MPLMNMIQSLNSALKLEMERDPNVIVLGEDVGKDGGVFRVTEGLMEKFGENRVIDTPLAESGIVGVSLGLALAGWKPVAEIQFSGFIYPAFDQIISHVSRMRNRSRGTYHCPLVVRTPCSGGVKSLEHHGESMEALFVHTPGINVVMPSSPYDAKGLMASSVENLDPVIFFEPLKAYRAMKEEVPEEYYKIPLGEAKVKREGSDATIVTYGTMVKPSLDAAEELQKLATPGGVTEAILLAIRNDTNITPDAAHAVGMERIERMKAQ